jgi:hypothetical protein
MSRLGKLDPFEVSDKPTLPELPLFTLVLWSAGVWFALSAVFVFVSFVQNVDEFGAGDLIRILSITFVAVTAWALLLRRLLRRKLP